MAECYRPAVPGRAMRWMKPHSDGFERRVLHVPRDASLLEECGLWWERLESVRTATDSGAAAWRLLRERSLALFADGYRLLPPAIRFVNGARRIEVELPWGPELAWNTGDGRRRKRVRDLVAAVRAYNELVAPWIAEGFAPEVPAWFEQVVRPADLHERRTPDADGGGHHVEWLSTSGDGYGPELHAGGAIGLQSDGEAFGYWWVPSSDTSGFAVQDRSGHGECMSYSLERRGTLQGVLVTTGPGEPAWVIAAASDATHVRTQWTDGRAVRWVVASDGTTRWDLVGTEDDRLITYGEGDATYTPVFSQGLFGPRLRALREEAGWLGNDLAASLLLEREGFTEGARLRARGVLGVDWFHFVAERWGAYQTYGSGSPPDPARCARGVEALIAAGTSSDNFARDYTWFMNPAMVVALIDHGVPLAWQDGSLAATFLLWASSGRRNERDLDPAVHRWLYREMLRVTPARRDATIVTALVEAGRLDEARTMLGDGAFSPRDLAPAMYAAVRDNHVELIDVLHRAGAVPYYGEPSPDVLTYASSVDAVRALLRAGLPTTRSSRDDRPALITVLGAAASRANPTWLPEVVQLLLDAGAPPNARGAAVPPAIHYARRGSAAWQRTVDQLVAHGANLDAVHAWRTAVEVVEAPEMRAYIKSLGGVTASKAVRTLIATAGTTSELRPGTAAFAALETLAQMSFWLGSELVDAHRKPGTLDGTSLDRRVRGFVAGSLEAILPLFEHDDAPVGQAFAEMLRVHIRRADDRDWEYSASDLAAIALRWRAGGINARFDDRSDLVDRSAKLAVGDAPSRALWQAIAREAQPRSVPPSYFNAAMKDGCAELERVATLHIAPPPDAASFVRDPDQFDVVATAAAACGVALDLPRAFVAWSDHRSRDPLIELVVRRGLVLDAIDPHGELVSARLERESEALRPVFAKLHATIAPGTARRARLDRWPAGPGLLRWFRRDGETWVVRGGLGGPMTVARFEHDAWREGWEDTYVSAEHHLAAYDRFLTERRVEGTTELDPPGGAICDQLQVACEPLAAAGPERGYEILDGRARQRTILGERFAARIERHLFDLDEAVTLDEAGLVTTYESHDEDPVFWLERERERGGWATTRSRAARPS